MKPVTALILMIGFLLFGIFLWPGLYHYGHDSRMGVPYRVNRITGTTKYLIMGAWVSFDTHKKNNKPWSEEEEIKQELERRRLLLQADTSSVIPVDTGVESPDVSRNPK